MLIYKFFCYYPDSTQTIVSMQTLRKLIGGAFEKTLTITLHKILEWLVWYKINGKVSSDSWL